VIGTKLGDFLFIIPLGWSRFGCKTQINKEYRKCCEMPCLISKSVAFISLKVLRKSVLYQIIVKSEKYKEAGK
jgi:hypothetical protein